ncbi:ectonucleotide pyrophosphatase phosphodiesterase family member 2-like protein [Labeo rohita]|uniref:Ectonucleotide pyrophosphatase phosphodiesterase family member 2-like protein n=1 Tax=Labeo rohita TaxID=84645 RepID=A0A498MZ93_LABRO|nr:ectonucleotide pyrophosphatase phosphodiesterase family member 2-like protein [Labeo rohita]
MNLHRCVNVILVGDHDVPKEIVANLTCKMPNQHFKPYLKQHLPKRLHYANNRRIEDVHLLMDRKWHVAMWTIFLGFGPSFNFKTQVPVFENIELYNVMCDVTHLPFGRPAVLFQTSYAQLCHSDYCSGYSHVLNMPLWSEFTLTAQVEVPAVSSSECVRADPRLDLTHTCNSYSQEPDVTHAFLYPPDFSVAAEARYEASLITNTVPMYPAFKSKYCTANRNVLRRYSLKNNGINVIMGPIFDHDHDGVRDTEEKIKEHALGSVFIPTHFYSIISSCENLNETLDECDGDLRVTCFILPHRADNSESCNSWEDESRWVEDLLKLHTARVRDVELLTGLDFYRSTVLPYTRVLTLKTHMRTFEDDVNRCYEPLDVDSTSCRCDSQCVETHSCCFDYKDICLLPTESWECTTLRCGERRLSDSKCHCSDDCMSAGDCCTNYNSICQERCGTSAPFMQSVFPSKTFPNHYSIATGLYAESHGLVDNNMYDPVFNASFSLSSSEKNNPRWYQGQPIWNTAMYQGLKAGTFFWPGSDVAINGSFPDIYMSYDGPDFFTIYLEEPDSSGHDYGPVSGGETSCERKEALQDFIGDVNHLYVNEGPFGRIRAKNTLHTLDAAGLVANMSCKRPEQQITPYLKHHLPKRFHYANNRRIEDVSVLVNPRWLFERYPGSLTFCSGGNHGYDNDVYSMQASFLSLGPKFHFQTEVEPFSNIELYNLMCDVLEITPFHNNGTHGSMNHLLRTPVYNPSHPTEQSSPEQCPSGSDINARLNLSDAEDLNHTSEDQFDALTLGNVVPVYPQFKRLWQYFQEVLLIKYASQYNGINVVTGPVYDYNFDGHFDSPEQIHEFVAGSPIPVPTHYFAVLTSCQNDTQTVSECSGELQTVSFLLPHRSDNMESCADGQPESQWAEPLLWMHQSRVRDVEWITGLDFFQDSKRPVAELLRLKTRPTAAIHPKA